MQFETDRGGGSRDHLSGDRRRKHIGKEPHESGVVGVTGRKISILSDVKTKEESDTTHVKGSEIRRKREESLALKARDMSAEPMVLDR